ncbi:ASCH domain-containing protein [Virgibacillus kekensis]|uniref:ASCH domain-containing protein n=1 Tax=Virgibacillus kekensis TaxID=202261 RepID=A0ABV9DMK9_9BACI
MNHTMGVYEEYFTAIKEGKKTVEVRLHDEKRRNINIGDTIEFTNLPSRDETIKVQVTDLKSYKTFPAMYQDIPYRYFGEEEISLEEMVEGTYQIYTPDQEARWGTLAIWIVLLAD